MSTEAIVILIFRFFSLYVIVSNIPPLLTLLLSGSFSFSALVAFGAFIAIGFIAVPSSRDLASWVMRDLAREV